MTENKILIYAGTTEGRRLAEFLVKREVSVHVCVATEYGESLLPEGSNITTTHERMDENQMIEFINEYHPSYVVDATHPYAIEVTENLQNACEKAGVPYLRILRDTGAEKSDCIYVDSMEEAIEYLEQTTGNILATTGSKELAAFQNLTDYKKRVYARVLSTAKVAHKCEQLGFTGKNLICMQGPFSEELNEAMLKSAGSRYFVTKSSGKEGGFAEKCRAARAAGATFIVVERPEAECPEKKEGQNAEKQTMTLQEACQLLEGVAFKASDGTVPETDREVYLIGMGPGRASLLSVETRQVLASCEVLIGSGRMLQEAHQVLTEDKPCFISVRKEEIAAYLKEHSSIKRAAVLYSGDVGFSSGAKGMEELLAGSFRVVVFRVFLLRSIFCHYLDYRWRKQYL